MNQGHIDRFARVLLQIDEVSSDDWLEGQLAAFNVLVKKYRTRIHDMAYLHLGNSHDAEDTVQDTLVEALGALLKKRYRGGCIEAWLFTIAKCNIRDQMRCKWTRDVSCFSELSDDTETDPANQQQESSSTLFEEIVRIRQRLAFREAISHLSATQKDVVFLTSQGHSTKEIAGKLRIPESSVRTYRVRARRRVQSVLKNILPCEPPPGPDRLRTPPDGTLHATTRVLRVQRS